MGRRTYTLSTPGFVADADSVSLSTGRQVDWESITAQDGRKFLPAGTLVGVNDDGQLIPAAPADGEEDPANVFGILVTSAHENLPSDAKTGYGVYVGGVFYENLLPDREDADFDDLREALGPRFVWETYEDDRAS